jgi:hypothetical protein
MYLNVILTIFVVLQVVIIFLGYKWWTKYGRNLFKTFSNLNQNIPQSNFTSESNKLLGQIPDMGKMMKEFEKMTKNLGKFK